VVCDVEKILGTHTATICFTLSGLKLGLQIFVCRTEGKLCFGGSSGTYLVAVLTEAEVVNFVSFQTVSSPSRKQG
jgi:hypothetical protein